MADILLYYTLLVYESSYGSGFQPLLLSPMHSYDLFKNFAQNLNIWNALLCSESICNRHSGCVLYSRFFQARSWMTCPEGGQNLLVQALWRAKALFPYVNLQNSDSVGGSKTMQKFSFGEHCLSCPTAGACLDSYPPCRYRVMLTEVLL